MKLQHKKETFKATRYVVLILLLIAAQLAWWVIFFQLSQNEVYSLQAELDRLKIEKASNSKQIPESMFRKKDGSLAIKPEILKKRQEKGTRQLWMLISETGFLLLVIAAGAWRMLAALKQERELEAARNLFLNNVTHELKTPIAGLQLNLETLLKRELKEQIRKELLEQGLSETRRLSEKVNQLLMGTFADTIKAPENLSSNIKTVIEYVLKRKQKEINHSSEGIHVEMPDSLIAKIPPAWLDVIVANLIQNALLYCDRPEIKIKHRVNETEIKIIVEDNGPGIEKKQLENIFLPLVRLEHNKGFLAGSGMGLYISRKLAESCGGKLVAIPEYTKGAAFELSLIRVNNEDTTDRR